MAALIRSKLQAKASARPRRPRTDPLLEVAGLVSDGHLTTAIDEELYDI